MKRVEKTVWDREQIQYLIEDAKAKGEQPSVILIGQHEADALRAFLAESFGEETESLQGYHYAGLPVVVLSVPSVLRVETIQSIYRQSRHNPETHTVNMTPDRNDHSVANTFRLVMDEET